MKYKALLYLPAVSILALCAPLAQAGTITVTTTDNQSGPEDGKISLDEALRSAADDDVIRFNIPGAGPHFIATPLGGYPLITANHLTIEGYSQPGSSPNTNPILGGNNAKIQIVLDSTGDESGAIDPQDPDMLLNSRRSTRILHSGYGDSENGILAVFEADFFNVSGLCFIARRSAGSTQDPAIYAVALVKEASNAHIHGCLFGIAPGGSTQADLKPVASAVAGFRYRTGGDVYSFDAVIGTDGDGVKDRAEFNVAVGGRDTFALELPGARISGNYVNVFPDGLHFVDLDDNYAQWGDVYEAGGSDRGDVTIENFEIGRSTANSVIGTNGDGISDSDERNVFGSVVYDHLGETYGGAANVVVAGNYFGVGVDGITRSPVSTNTAPDFIDFGGNGQVRIGSNGDGVSDDLEGNLIVNVSGKKFWAGNASSLVVSRRNSLVDCGFAAIPFADGANGAPSKYATYYIPYLANPDQGVAPVLQSLVGGILKVTLPAPTEGYPNSVLDLYRVDPAALAKTTFWPAALVHPGTYLGSFTDNGPGDLNPVSNELSIDVSAFGLTDTTYIAAAASYSAVAGSFNAPDAVTTPMSNPISAKPTLSITVDTTALTAELSWLGAPDAFDALSNPLVNSATGWAALPADSTVHTGGRNVLPTTFDPAKKALFYRLQSK